MIFVLVKSHNRHTESGAAIGQIIDILPSNVVPQSKTNSFDYAYWNGRLPNNYALCLVQVWEKTNQALSTYVNLSLADSACVRDIDELVKSSKAVWCCGSEINDITCVFKYKDLQSQCYPSLNGIHNVSFSRYEENAIAGEYGELGDFSPFQQ